MPSTFRAGAGSAKGGGTAASARRESSRLKNKCANSGDFAEVRIKGQYGGASMDGCRRNPDVIGRQGSAALPQLDEYLAIDVSDIAIDIQRFNSRMLQKQRECLGVSLHRAGSPPHPFVNLAKRRHGLLELLVFRFVPSAR